MLENLRTLREGKKMTQKQLAEAVGVSQQSINKYENHNVEPDIQTLQKMADLFQTSVDYLIGRRADLPVCPSELTRQEQNLIYHYRHLNDKQKKLVEALIASYME